MTFDIYQMDHLDPDDDLDYEYDLEDYAEELIDLFVDSPEGLETIEKYPEIGFWTYQLIDLGYNYNGVTLTQMDADDVAEMLIRLFPRKISLESPEDADEAIPELMAFWRFLKREFKLPAADHILKLLPKIEPEFKKKMNDPSNFGLAKSFFTMGQAAGFDMSDQEEMDRFVELYNSGLLNDGGDIDPQPEGGPGGSLAERFLGGKTIEFRPENAGSADPKKKKKRKMSKASRKKNKKKRKR